MAKKTQTTTSAPPAESAEQATEAGSDYRQTLLEGQDFSEETPAAEPEEEAVPASPDEAQPETEEPEPEMIQEPSFLDQARELGIEAESEEQARQALVDSFRSAQRQQQESLRLLEEREELARFGTEYLREQREKREAEARLQQQQEVQEEGWWNPPKFEQKWLEQYRDVTVSETGEPTIGWKKGTPREVI